MATKLAETNTKMRCSATLDHTRSSHPEANYLDVFSSTCWSSNQLSLDQDFHYWSKDVMLPMASTDKHNTSACSEASSFECIDVALESHEEVNRGAKTVRKRQIQLKRRDTVEFQTNENNNNGVLQVAATPSRPRDTLQRQHSTPAAFHQDSHRSEPKSGQTERKQRLQKSFSLDETSSKTKMASCIIKTILSKKMQQEENLRAMEISDRAFATIKVYNTTSSKECVTSSVKDVYTETMNVTLGTCPPLSSSQSPTQETESQATNNSTKEHYSISSKTQSKVITKHISNNLFSGLGKTEFHGGGTEITASPEIEKEKLSSSKDMAWLTSQNPGQKLSCDSAKGKAWNSSAVISRAIGKQAAVKTTPEECCTVQGGQKLPSVKTDKGELKESTQCFTNVGYLAYDLDARTVGNVISQSAQCSAVKERERDAGEPRAPGQSVNMSIQNQGKFKAIAPVHVVRDMRNLVKNTYNQSFKGVGEAVHRTEHGITGFPPPTSHPISSKGEDKRKGYKPMEKPRVQKVTPPLALDKIKDFAFLHATPTGCATKTTSLLESHNKTFSAGFTKVNPIITAKENSCALSKSPEALTSQTAISQVDIQGRNLKQTNWAAMAVQANKETSTEISKNGHSGNSSRLGYEKRKDSAEHQRQNLVAAMQYCLPTTSCNEPDSCNQSEQVCSSTEDGYQTQGPLPRPQSAAGPPSTCILTVTAAPVLPPYFCKPNALGYYTVSPPMGAISYVQGPVLLQTPSHNQTVMANGPISLMRSLSEEVRLLSQPYITDGKAVQHSSPKQTEKEETRLKMPSPDTQQCTTFIATLGAEVIQGSAGMLYPEVSGSLAQNPRQLLLDPESGRCFFVDMPQLPQRKMLFDPETCQYVEVLLPQQTLSGTVVPSPCAIPFPSLHVPAIYTPHCLPYVQVHPQVLPPPGP